MDIVVPVDVEQVVYDVLSAQFPNVGATPQGGPDGLMALPFVAYELTGGSRRNMVTDSVLVMIRCYGNDRAETSRLCREAYAYLMAEQYRPDGVVRSAKSVGGPVFYPDAESKTLRYQASVQWQIRPEIL